MNRPVMTNYAYQSALGNVVYNILLQQAIPMLNAGLGAIFGPQQINASLAEGSYTLTYLGQTTTELTSLSTAAEIQAAIEALSTVGAGNANVTDEGNGQFLVQLFDGLSGGVTVSAPGGSIWSSLLQFDASSTIYRNQRSILQPTICVYPARDDLGQRPILATLTGLVQYVVTISLRLPYVVAPPASTGNEPEAFTRTGDMFRDTIASVFSSEQNLVPEAVNAKGQSILPPLDNVFAMLLYAGCVDDIPVRDSAGPLHYSKWDCRIVAVKTTQFNRVGG